MVNSVRALLVEDDSRVARVNRDLLEAHPEVRVVGTGTNCAEGDRLARDLHPDLALLDVYLPDGSGLDLLRAWRARGEVFEVVMVTAAGDAGAALSRFQLRRRLAQTTFDQRQLDRYLRGTAEPTLPRGVDLHTLERVAGLLRGCEHALSAEDVGLRANLSRPTAWRYLEYLVGAVRAELDYQYGAGRPFKLYRTSRT